MRRLGTVKDTGLGDLELAEGEFVHVASYPVGRYKREGSRRS
jgi:hypothetical protein